MQMYTWLLLLSVMVIESCAEDKKFYWTEKYLAKRITIRLIQKNWHPLGPSGETDEYLDEYKWDAHTAYKSLTNSNYDFAYTSLADAEELFRYDGEYNKELDSIIIMHPVFNTADYFFVRTTVNALAMRNVHKKYNLFAVNMPMLNFNMALTVLKNLFHMPTKYEIISDMVSRFLITAINDKLLSPSQIHLLGYSYSGHLVGYMARHISLLYGQKINTILSLDPYTNSFNSNLIPVSKEDAQVVHIFHTNSLMAGTRERIGTADIVFNSGVIQPECWSLTTIVRTLTPPNMCSHSLVVKRLWYIILYPSKFVARQCDSWNRMSDCICDKNPTATVSYPITDREMTGTHFLRTSQAHPYGMGMKGAECPPEDRNKALSKQDALRQKYQIPDLNQLFSNT